MTHTRANHHKRMLAAMAVLALFVTLVVSLLVVLEPFQGPVLDGNSRDAAQETQRMPVAESSNRPAKSLYVTNQPPEAKGQISGAVGAAIDSAKTQSVTLVFEDEVGNAIPRVAIRYSLLTLAALKAEPAGRPDSESSLPRTTLTGIADEVGTLRLLDGVDYEGNKDGLRLTVATAGWIAERTSADAGYRWRLLHGEVGCRLGAGSNRVTVILGKSSLLSLSVIYEDGEPYQGEFRVGVAGKTGRSRTAFFDLVANQTVEVIIPQGAKSITAYTKGKRRGFREDWSFTVDTNAEVVRLAIPRFEAQTELRVNLYEWPSADSVVVTIRFAGSDRTLVDQTVVGQVWSTRTLPGPAQYYVEVVSSGLVWKSNAFALAPGETKELRPLPSAPFQCRLTVLDETGNPLAGAKVHTNADYYPSWYTDFPRQEVRQTSSTNAAGVARITDLFPGKLTLYAEAAGFEPGSVTVEGRAGSDIDAGTLRLRPATSAIQIEFKNRNANRKYILFLFSPRYGTPVAGQVNMNADTVTLPALPAREYVVYVGCDAYPPIKVSVETRADETTVLTIDLGPLGP